MSDDWHTNPGEPPPIDEWLEVCNASLSQLVLYSHAWVYKITAAGPDWNGCPFVPTHWRVTNAPNQKGHENHGNA
jgi:hypothetical protein